MPYSTTSYGVDIASIKFIGVTKVPTVQWRCTQNMSTDPNLVANATGLGFQDEGVMAVTVQYTFTPLFTSYFAGPIVMKLQSFARSRKSSNGFVTCSTGGTTCS